MTADEKALFRSKIEDSPDSATSMSLLKDLRAASRANEFTREEEIELSLSVFSILRRQARTEGILPRSAIVEYALPVGVQHSEEDETKFSLYSLRELIGEWIHEMPGEWALSLSEECSALLVHRLTVAVESEISPICWMIGDVGYRNQATVDALEKALAANTNGAGDVVLGTLIGLGGFQAHRSRYLALAQNRALTTRNNSIEYVLSTLGDVSTVDFLLTQWVPKQARDVLVSVVSILGHLASQNHDPILTKKISEALVTIDHDFRQQLGNTLLIRGDIVTQCDSEKVVELLIRQLDTLPKDPSLSDSIIRQAVVRLLACWQPAQLKGCDVTPSDTALAAIRSVLLSTEDYDGRSLTPLNHFKDYLVDGLLRLGRPEIFEWYRDILAAQKNPYWRHEFLQRMALFQFDDFPPEIVNMITEVRDLEQGKDDSELLVRLSASRLLRSSPSKRTFDILLRPGLTFKGSVMRDSVEALADVALALTDDDSQYEYVISELTRRLTQSASAPIESSVCRALNALAMASRLKASEIPKLADFIAQPIDEDRLFVKSLLVQALGTFPQPLVPADAITSMVAWARQRDDWLSWRSIEALIRMSLFAEYPDWLPAKLGLSQRDGQWEWAPGPTTSSWASSFVVLLYEKAEEEFAGALADIILADDWQASDRATLALVNLCQNKNLQVYPEIGRALIEKAKKRNRPNSADTAVISYLPHLCGKEFAREAWSDIWTNWTDDGRAALADAFGQLEGPAERERVVPMLKSLLHDTHFGVRRTSARSLAKINQNAFLNECVQSASSAVIEDRRQAAESLPWLSHSPEIVSLVDQLANDVMLSVRESTKTSLESRKRLGLAKTYLARLTLPNTSGNPETLAVLRYGQALVDTGDDETLSKLNAHLEKKEMSSRVRLLIRRVYKKLESKWRSVKQKWPDPLSDAKGTLHTGKAQLRYGTHDVAMDFKLWNQTRPGIGALSRWGGTAVVQGGLTGQEFSAGEATLVFADGFTTKVGIFETFASTDKNTTLLEFQGVDDYPLAHVG